ncbi:DUF6194 family protein [Streptomyces sp. NPDC007088]|uniref:DUF6194 family protein n=1 Tax=Streptomyces sp. NPDC007088 TaxID=3364773 RepID=UPI0036906E18
MSPQDMTVEEIVDFVQDLHGVLTVRPAPGDGSPAIGWGDVFFFYAPDGVVPQASQPFATVVTKDYPGDESSRLDRPDAFRVSVAAPREDFLAWTGHTPRDRSGENHDRSGENREPGAFDTVTAHPVYASAGWLAVVNPGPRTATATRTLLLDAWRAARARHERRTGSGARP